MYLLFLAPKLISQFCSFCLLRLESPTRTLTMEAPRGVEVSAQKGLLRVSGRKDLQLESTEGEVSCMDFTETDPNMKCSFIIQGHLCQYLFNHVLCLFPQTDTFRCQCCPAQWAPDWCLCVFTCPGLPGRGLV